MYELIRKTVIITLCLLLSKVLHLTVSVYLVLFAIVLANTSYSKHISDMLKVLLPSVLAAGGALLINQLFAEHPFIIWTVCIVYFDHVRRQANNNLRVMSATLPLFLIIFITTYANAEDYILVVPNLFRDVLLSAIIAVVVTSFVNHLMPIRISRPNFPIVSFAVTGTDRLKLLLLVGGGLAFVMINEVTSAVFCLVPLITSAMQPTHSTMKAHASEKLLSQVGGCSLAMLASVMYSGTQINLVTFFIVSFVLVYTLLYWSQSAHPNDRSIHADALMGFLVPYQLYIAKTGNDFGLSLIALRAVELIITLVIIIVVAHWLDRLGQASTPENMNLAEK